MSLLILPHQLFDCVYFPDFIKNVVIYEHPHYFDKYNYNKKKIILHRASMKCYADELRSKKCNYKVKYVLRTSKLSLPKSYYVFDPIDKIKLPDGHNILRTPGVLLSRDDYEEYQKKTKKFVFNNFYLWSKKKLKLYEELVSLDSQNRKVKPDDVKPPPLCEISDTDKKYVKKAIRFCSKYYGKNYGTTKDFQYPVTRKTAKKWLRYFLEKKFNLFGPYQDYVSKDLFDFHSVLSSSLNIGLLCPSEIMVAIEPYRKKVLDNSFEGFVRQLFWREYQAYCYEYVDLKSMDFFKTKKKITNDWYEGTLGIPPVDDLIKSGFEKGYIHHIGRLMFCGCWFVLSEIKKEDVFRWFMEFAIDSYEWVMCQNVYDMVMFSSGGITMRRPYICGSNYIVRNSHYRKSDPWCDEWDKAYRKFCLKHKDKLWKFRYYFPILRKKKT